MLKEEKVRRIVTALQTPKTIEQIQDALGGSYHTIYRHVQMAIEEGMVEEMPFREERRARYIATGSPYKGLVIIKTEAGAKELIAYGVLTGQPLTDLVRGAVAHLWRRSYARDTGQEHLMGYMTPVEVKAVVRELRKALRNYVMLCDQMLVADVWSDDSVHERFGAAGDIAGVMAAAEFYEATTEGMRSK